VYFQHTLRFDRDLSQVWASRRGEAARRNEKVPPIKELGASPGQAVIQLSPKLL
jgi:hypothetical protein